MTRLNKRIYCGLRVAIDTPLCISNGENELTDCDVLRNWDQIPFIPGSSLAGAFRSFCEETGQPVARLFGSPDDSSGKMSALWISDFYFDSDVHTSIRDGVYLKDKVAVAGGKYDYEVIEHGTGIIYLQLLIWDDMDENKAVLALQHIAGGIRTGDIRLGAQKNRGLGKLKLLEVYCKEFSADNVDEWIGFTKEALIVDACRKNLDQWCIGPERYTTFLVPLTLTGGLSIRQYSTKVHEPDFISLMRKTDEKNERPVIPGSSWRGALRSRIEEILQALGLEQYVKTECRDIFGYVETGKAASVKASEVVISESVLESSRFIRSVRNQVSRFENSTVQGALFEERCAVGGYTVLEIKVKQLVGRKYDWFIGVILLAVKDLQKGYLPVGGGAAIGRGIFAARGDIVIRNGCAEADYMKALHQKISEVQ